ncbi:MAG: helix-turn-helix domain-containing protein, partial [Nitrospirae bacterium]|nr:helix-turn-helix domain-containing protein [Nitrospirota bacterium]
LYEQDTPQREIARRVGLTLSTVYRIIKRHRDTHTGNCYKTGPGTIPEIAVLESVS